MATNRPKAAPVRTQWETFNENERFTCEDHKGALIGIQPKGWERNIPGEGGSTFDALVCEIVVIRGEHEGSRWDDGWITSKTLQVQLKNKMGKRLLGTLTQTDPPVDEYGQTKLDENGREYSGSWRFAPATQEDYDVAEAFEAAQRAKLQAAPRPKAV